MLALVVVAMSSGACDGDPAPDEFELGDAFATEQEQASAGEVSEDLEAFGDEFDELISDEQPQAACVACSFFSTFRCSSLGWPAACLPTELPGYPTSENCGYCDQWYCNNVPATGTVSASPTQVQVYGDTGCSSISWDACKNVEIWVSHNGAPESLFASGSSGTQSACWIQPEHTYEFCAYEGNEHANQLDCVTVTGIDAGDPPDPCDSCPVGQSCSCEPGVCWPNNLQCP